EFKLIQASTQAEQQYRKVPQGVTNMIVPALIDHYKKRIQTNGWDDARPAMAVMIRAMYLVSFIHFQVAGSPGDAITLLRKAIAFLTAARKELLPLAGPPPAGTNVPGRENHFQQYDIMKAGSVLRLSIVRSLQSLLVQAIMKGHTTSRDNRAFDLEEVKRVSEAMIESAEEQQVELMYGGADFFASYYLMHMGQAHMNLAYYYAQKSNEGDSDADAENGNNNGEVYDFNKDFTFRAAHHYALSAKFYPEDSLHRVYALYRYMFSAMRVGAITVGKLIEMYEKMRKSVGLVVEYYPLSEDPADGEREVFASMEGDAKRIVDEAYKMWKDALDVVEKGLEKSRKEKEEKAKKAKKSKGEEKADSDEEEEEDVLLRKASFPIL
ncbi:hypothetical protein HK102_010115, partial [Quaeritorhiza haematococci]